MSFLSMKPIKKIAILFSLRKWKNNIHIISRRQSCYRDASHYSISYIAFYCHSVFPRRWIDGKEGGRKNISKAVMIAFAF